MMPKRLFHTKRDPIVPDPKNGTEKEKEKSDPVNPVIVELAGGPPLCNCGKPVAPGQTYVCTDHIRSS